MSLTNRIVRFELASLTLTRALTEVCCRRSTPTTPRALQDAEKALKEAFEEVERQVELLKKASASP